MTNMSTIKINVGSDNEECIIGYDIGINYYPEEIIIVAFYNDGTSFKWEFKRTDVHSIECEGIVKIINW